MMPPLNGQVPQPPGQIPPGVPPKQLTDVTVDGKSYTLANGKVTIPTETGEQVEYLVYGGMGPVNDAIGENILLPANVSKIGSINVHGRVLSLSKLLRVEGDLIGESGILAYGGISSAGDVKALDGSIVVHGNLVSRSKSGFPIQAEHDIIVYGVLSASSASTVQGAVYCDNKSYTELYANGPYPISSLKK